MLANDLYHELTREGFKVFFARITLEDKLGSAYEPYIFAALNSAKVMVVLGTKPEYFNAAWVRNEWSRYLALIKQGQKKVLIPAYKDMDPYDLPEEFSHLQAQDMSKLGFMQDLIRGIRKITADVSKSSGSKTTIISSTSANPAALLKRTFMFVEDGDWNAAREYANRVLDIEPENANAFLALLMTDLKVQQRESLGKINRAFNNNNNYQKIMRFGNAELTAELAEYCKYATYNDAILQMQAAKDTASFEKAANLFESIRTHRDSASLAKICHERACEYQYERARNIMSIAKSANDYEKAAALFDGIEGMKDSAALARKCRERAIVYKYDAAYSVMRNANSVNEYNRAAALFEELGDYRRSKFFASDCRKIANRKTKRSAIVNAAIAFLKQHKTAFFVFGIIFITIIAPLIYRLCPTIMPACTIVLIVLALISPFYVFGGSNKKGCGGFVAAWILGFSILFVIVLLSAYVILPLLFNLLGIDAF